MSGKAIEREFKRYLKLFKEDPELWKCLNQVTFQDIYNPTFLQENSKFTSMDDMIWRSGFGIVNLMEVENVNSEKWDLYIADNTDCSTWYEFGKLAMVKWMKMVIESVKKEKH